MKKGWPIKRLGDLSEVITKGTTPTSVGFGFVPSGINFIKVESISETGDFIENKLAHISKECHDSFRRSQLKVGDILFSIAGALGRTAIITKAILPANTNQALAIIRLKPSNEVHPEFVRKALETGIVLEQVEKMRGGVAQQNLSLAQVQGFKIPIPPLSEQHRIVKTLDQAFEGLATAKANAEKNLLNARALFESYLNSVFTKRGEGWEEMPLGDAFITVTGSTPSKSIKSYYGNFMPFVKPPELLDDIVDSASDNLSKEGANVARTLPIKSVLVSCIGNLGKIGFNVVEVAFNQQINAILPKEKLALPEFVFFQALSIGFRNKLESMSSGTTVPIVNKSRFNSIKFLLPPLVEQKNIVSRAKTLREETRRLEMVYQNRAEKMDALKKSLLHQAFQGEL